MLINGFVALFSLSFFPVIFFGGIDQYRTPLNPGTCRGIGSRAEPLSGILRVQGREMGVMECW